MRSTPSRSRTRPRPRSSAPKLLMLLVLKGNDMALTFEIDEETGLPDAFAGGQDGLAADGVDGMPADGVDGGAPADVPLPPSSSPANTGVDAGTTDTLAPPAENVVDP